MKLKIYTDGGARGNPGPAAIGVVVCTEDDKLMVEHKEYLGEATNNVAEYTAVIRGLEIAVEYKAKDVAFTSDSELLVKQMNGEYKVKAEHLKTLFDEAQKLIEQVGKVSFTHVRRDYPKIQHADRLVNETLDAIK